MAPKSLIAISYGSRMENGLIQLGTVEEKQASNNKKLIMIAVPLGVVILLVFFYLKYMGYF